jgi:hypothetical protein
MKNLLSIVLLLSLSACSIEPLSTTSTEANDPYTDTYDQNDANEPSNGTPNDPGAPSEMEVEPEYLLRCPMADGDFTSGEFTCAGLDGFYLADGSTFLCSPDGTCAPCDYVGGGLVMCYVSGFPVAE